jgi:acetylornithine deacetylase
MHILLLILLAFWGVGSSLSDWMDQGGGTRVVITSPAVGQGLVAQIRGELTEVEVEPRVEPVERGSAPTIPLTRVTAVDMPVRETEIETTALPQEAPAERPAPTPELPTPTTATPVPPAPTVAMQLPERTPVDARAEAEPAIPRARTPETTRREAASAITATPARPDVQVDPAERSEPAPPVVLAVNDAVREVLPRAHPLPPRALPPAVDGPAPTPTALPGLPEAPMDRVTEPERLLPPLGELASRTESPVDLAKPAPVAPVTITPRAPTEPVPGTSLADVETVAEDAPFAPAPATPATAAPVLAPTELPPMPLDRMPSAVARETDEPETAIDAPAPPTRSAVTVTPEVTDAARTVETTPTTLTLAPERSLHTSNEPLVPRDTALPDAGRRTPEPLPALSRAATVDVALPALRSEAMPEEERAPAPVPLERTARRPRPADDAALQTRPAATIESVPTPARDDDTRSLLARSTPDAPRAAPTLPVPTVSADFERVPLAAMDLDVALPALSVPNPQPQRSEDQRLALVEEMGGSEETERAVKLALDWLARHQSADGRWDSDDYDDECGACDGQTRIDVDIAVTGLALLCFYAADHTHLRDGPYRDTVERGLAWLRGQQGRRGDVLGAESMYSHGIATIALAEAYGMTGDATLRDPVTRAAQFILDARNRREGGWRYVPRQAGDTSVLGWQIMALTSVRKAGIELPDDGFEAADEWLDMVGRRGGRYAYQPGDPATPAMTAEGMFVRQLLGRTPADPTNQASAAYVLSHPPRWEEDANTYYWYYATLALYQHQGEPWRRWNRWVSRELLAHQISTGDASGSWDPADQWSRTGGRIYQTAICTLTLDASGPGGETAIAAHVTGVLERLGMDVEVHESAPGRPSVVGRLRGSGGGRSLMLNGHIDTVGVGGMTDPFTPREEGGRLYGRGAYDMKGGVAACIAAVHELVRSGATLRGDVLVAAVADEEDASLGTRDVARRYPVDGAIVAEPTELQLSLAHKGFVWIDVETGGFACHGSMADRGVDANLRMGRVLGRVAELSGALRERRPHTLVGAPSLHAPLVSGGVGPSVYSPRCTLRLERRTVPGETTATAVDEIEAIIADLRADDPDLEVSAHDVLTRDPFEGSADGPLATALTGAYRTHAGVAPEIVGVPFWTDATFLRAAGADTIVFGPSGLGAHEDEEWVDIASVETTTRVFRDVALAYCG